MSTFIHSFARRQGGHVTWAQLLETGMTKRTISRWIVSGKLIRVYHGVYAVGHLQSNPFNAAHAALLAGGPGSALAGPCALVLWGIWRRWPRALEIVMGADRRPAGLIVHQSNTLARRDITLVRGLRVTSPARTLLDTATRLTPPQLTRALADLRLRDQLSLSQLADVLARNPTHPAVTLLRPHLELAQPEPTRSTLEDHFLALLRTRNLPTPRINVHLCGFRVDVYFPEQRLIVELDGWGTHRFRERFVGDRRQDFEILRRTGIPTVRLSSEDVTDTAVNRLGGLLASRAADACDESLAP